MRVRLVEAFHYYDGPIEGLVDVELHERTERMYFNLVDDDVIATGEERTYALYHRIGTSEESGRFTESQLERHNDGAGS